MERALPPENKGVAHFGWPLLYLLCSFLLINVIPNPAHAVYFRFCHGAVVKGLQVLPHLLDASRAHHAHINGGIGQDEPIAINSRRGCLTRWHLLGLEKPLPRRGGEGDDPWSVFPCEIWKGLLLRPPVGRVVADVKAVKESFFVKLRKDLSIMAGKPDKTRHALLLQPQGPVNNPLAGPPGIITQYKDIRIFDAQIPQPALKEPLGQKRAVRVGEHGDNKAVSFAFPYDVPDRLSHGRGSALDEGPPGKVIAALLKGLLEGLNGCPET
jgi:hypothetical protein